jgi:hypothetical protein
MPGYKLVFSVAEEEITRDIAATSDDEAVADSLRILKNDPHEPDIGTLFVHVTGGDYRPLCSLCPKTDDATPI